MKLKDIAIDNIKRRKSKMVFIILGMVIGIATIVTIVKATQAATADIERKLDEYGANIMVLPKSNTLSMSYGGISIPGAQYDIQEIQQTELSRIWTIENRENLSMVSPKVLGSADIDGTRILVVGTDLATEIKLKKWWNFTENSNIELTRKELPSPIDPNRTITETTIKDLQDRDVILGHNVAEKLKKKVGDHLNLVKGNTMYEVGVRGILNETGSQDDSIIFMSLPIAQTLLSKEGKITLVEVAALCAGCPVEEMARQINTAIPNGKATPIKQVVAQKMETIQHISNFGLGLGIIILAIGSLIVFTTMMASVNDRVREIGIFRAIGFRRSHIMKIIFLEAFILSIAAGVIGLVIGLGVSIIVGNTLGEFNMQLLADPVLALTAILTAIIVSIGATIYPAFKASKIDPADALRHI
ncbi:MAG: ABC transporter permease [Spirochaetales bacterium]|nr:ABC transporter permease [Spirochaetales bacterium]